MTVYADTSFFVSIYIADIHSPRADKLLASGSRVWLTPLHDAEIAHAVAQHEFRSQMSPSKAQSLYQAIEQDRSSGIWTVTAMPEGVLERCADLAAKYVPQLGLRTLDTLHVAAALQLKANHFWTFDERQAKLAKAVGLKLT